MTKTEEVTLTSVSCNTTSVLHRCSSPELWMPSRNRLKEFVMILIKDTFVKQWSESQEIGMSVQNQRVHGMGQVGLPEQERAVAVICRGLAARGRSLRSDRPPER